MVERLPVESEQVWAAAVRRLFRTVAVGDDGSGDRPEPADEAFWQAGDATMIRYNDYTNQGRNDTSGASEAAGETEEHVGWGNAELKVHADGCYLDLPPRLKLYAAWGEARAVSTFADAAAAVAGLTTEERFALRTTPVEVVYEQTWRSVKPILTPDGQICWNKHNRVGPPPDTAAAAIESLGRSLETDELEVLGENGLAFIVDNSRVLHGRRAVPSRTRRRVVGGEAPASAVLRRWAELARVTS